MARDREPMDTYKAAGRFIAASGRHAAEGDGNDLAALLALHEATEKACGVAVAGMRARGYSWQEIANAVGMTKMGAYKRWNYVG